MVERIGLGRDDALQVVRLKLQRCVATIGLQAVERDAPCLWLNEPIFGDTRPFIEVPFDDAVLVGTACQRNLNRYGWWTVHITVVEACSAIVVNEYDVRGEAILAEANHEVTPQLPPQLAHLAKMMQSPPQDL